MKDKKGNTEAGNDKARNQPSEEKEKEDSSRQKLVHDANKQMAIEPFNFSRMKEHATEREASTKCKANGSYDNTRVYVEKVSNKKEKTTI